MYNNIGEKLKGLAVALAVIGVCLGGIWLVISLIAWGEHGEYLQFADAYYAYESAILYESGMEALAAKEGIKWSIVLIITSFISSWPLYGFGQLIENTDKLVAIQQVKPEEKKSIEDELPMI